MAKQTRTTKASRRLRGVKTGKGMSLETALQTLNVYATVPSTVSGFLVSMDSNVVIFRQKRTSGSKKVRIVTYQRPSVIEIFGAPGEISQLVYWKKSLISSIEGYVRKIDPTGAITIEDYTTGELTTVLPSDRIEIELFADEDEKIQRKANKKKKGSVKGSKASKVEEEEDLDDEDEEFEDEDEEMEDEDEDEDTDDEEDLDDEEEDEDEDEEEFEEDDEDEEEFEEDDD